MPHYRSKSGTSSGGQGTFSGNCSSSDEENTTPEPVNQRKRTLSDGATQKPLYVMSVQKDDKTASADEADPREAKLFVLNFSLSLFFAALLSKVLLSLVQKHLYRFYGADISKTISHITVKFLRDVDIHRISEDTLKHNTSALQHQTNAEEEIQKVFCDYQFVVLRIHRKTLSEKM